jgi:hypothetical protein
MSIMFDLIGSVIIGAYVLLMGIRLNSNIGDYVQSAMVTLNLQEGLVDAVRTMESDFRKIGYGALDPRTALEITQPDHIRFKADIDRNGMIERIDWAWERRVGASGDTTMELTRQVSGEPSMTVLLDVTSFRLEYFTEAGEPADTSAKGQIQVIQTALKIRSPYKVADLIKGSEEMKDAEVFWRQTRLASRNLKRHG